MKRPERSALDYFLMNPAAASPVIIRRASKRPEAATTDRQSLHRTELVLTQRGYFLTAPLIALFGLLQIGDGIITYLGLDSFGLDEANPILRAVSGLIGLGGAIATVKLCGLAFITFLFLERHKMTSCWITATLASADTFYGWVLTNNISLVLAA